MRRVVAVMRRSEEERGRLAGLGACLCCLLLLWASGLSSVEAREVDRRAGRSVRPAQREQTRFGAEEPVRRRANIPADVLRGLGQDEKVQSCLVGAQNAPVEIQASWFAASAIHLNADRLPDLIVKAENSCLFGANIAPFWVFRNTGRGYALALRVNTLALDVLPARTRGYRNIRASAATASRVITRHFRFDGQSYRESRR